MLGLNPRRGIEAKEVGPALLYALESLDRVHVAPSDLGHEGLDGNIQALQLGGPLASRQLVGALRDLVQQVADVAVHRPHRNAQLPGDLRVAVAVDLERHRLLATDLDADLFGDLLWRLLAAALFTRHGVQPSGRLSAGLPDLEPDLDSPLSAVTGFRCFDDVGGAGGALRAQDALTLGLALGAAGDALAAQAEGELDAGAGARGLPGHPGKVTTFEPCRAGRPIGLVRVVSDDGR